MSANLLETLIVFSRYPEAGKTKTRMIPALGAQGAAELQRQMTEHTLKTATKLQSIRNLSIEIHFAGGNLQLMSAWLGDRFSYIPQAEGDLGKKMDTAFQRAFGRGQQRVVIIGIDCPDLDCRILEQAFASLQAVDLTLGVAADGGYYLIGLKRQIPDLFQQIDWGTSLVLQQTSAIAQKLNLNTHYLTTLPDVDRPADLAIWHKHVNSEQ